MPRDWGAIGWSPSEDKASDDGGTEGQAAAAKSAAVVQPKTISGQTKKEAPKNVIALPSTSSSTEDGRPKRTRQRSQKRRQSPPPKVAVPVKRNKAVPPIESTQKSTTETEGHQKAAAAGPKPQELTKTTTDDGTPIIMVSCNMQSQPMKLTVRMAHRDIVREALSSDCSTSAGGLKCGAQILQDTLRLEDYLTTRGARDTGKAIAKMKELYSETKRAFENNVAKLAEQKTSQSTRTHSDLARLLRETKDVLSDQFGSISSALNGLHAKNEEIKRSLEEYINRGPLAPVSDDPVPPTFRNVPLRGPWHPYINRGPLAAVSDDPVPPTFRNVPLSGAWPPSPNEVAAHRQHAALNDPDPNPFQLESAHGQTGNALPQQTVSVESTQPVASTMLTTQSQQLGQASEQLQPQQPAQIVPVVGQQMASAADVDATSACKEPGEEAEDKGADETTLEHAALANEGEDYPSEETDAERQDDAEELEQHKEGVEEEPTGCGGDTLNGGKKAGGGENEQSVEEKTEGLPSSQEVAKKRCAKKVQQHGVDAECKDFKKHVGQIIGGKRVAFCYVSYAGSSPRAVHKRLFLPDDLQKIKELKTAFT